MLELVDGETLAARIQRGRIPTPEALEIASQITEALEAAHEKGIIHRDVKPANIKITLDGTVKVLDFGLSKVRDVEGGRTDLSDSPTIMAITGCIGWTRANTSSAPLSYRPSRRREIRMSR